MEIGTFAAPTKARYFRVYPQTWEGYPSMRAGLALPEGGVENPLNTRRLYSFGVKPLDLWC